MHYFNKAMENLALISAIAGLTAIMFFITDCTKQFNTEDTKANFEIKRLEVEKEITRLRELESRIANEAVNK